MSGRRGGAQRHRAAIIYRILVCCNGKPEIASRICRQVNLNSNIFHEVAEGLVACGFLSMIEQGGKRVCFVTSQRGFVFVKKYYDLLEVARGLERVFGDKLL